MEKNNNFESSFPATAQQSESDFALGEKPEDVFSNSPRHILNQLGPIRFELEFYKGQPEEKDIKRIYFQIENTNDDETKQKLTVALSKDYRVLLRHKISIMMKHILQLSKKLEFPMGVHEGVAYYYQSSYWIKLYNEDLNLFLVEVADTEKHAEHFYALQHDFQDIGVAIDPSCKDVCRLRGYSYDAKAYVNTNAVVYDKVAETHLVVPRKSSQPEKHRPIDECDSKFTYCSSQKYSYPAEQIFEIARKYGVY